MWEHQTKLVKVHAATGSFTANQKAAVRETKHDYDARWNIQTYSIMWASLSLLMINNNSSAENIIKLVV
jgi:hypothetical protein